MVKIYLIKIHTMENILFIIGIGKIYLKIKKRMSGLVFVHTESYGVNIKI